MSIESEIEFQDLDEIDELDEIDWKDADIQAFESENSNFNFQTVSNQGDEYNNKNIVYNIFTLFRQ